jgi:autonomous glycyl radical cofactor GrcA
VVSTPLKHISQLGLLFSRYEKLKHVPNHQPEWILIGSIHLNVSELKRKTLES